VYQKFQGCLEVFGSSLGVQKLIWSIVKDVSIELTNKASNKIISGSLETEVQGLRAQDEVN